MKKYIKDIISESLSNRPDLDQLLNDINKLALKFSRPNKYA